MKKILILTALAIISAIAAYAQKTVAVYVTGDQEDGIKKVLGSKMVTYITQSDDFSAVERTADFLSALNAEHDYQVSGEVTNSQIVKLGQQFGARYVAVVDVNEVYGDLFISSRLIDVQTSKIDSSYDASGSGGSLQALTELANKIADGLILGPARALEAKKKEAEQRKRAELQEKENQLRAQAIRNLTPDGTIQCGRYIVLNQPITARFSLNQENGNVYLSSSIPPNFEVAEASVLEYILINGYGYWRENRDYQHFLARNYIKRGEKFNRGKNCGEWECQQYHYSPYNEIIGSSYWFIMETKRQKDKFIVSKESTSKLLANLKVIVYRSALTEDEIQAEMRRISR